MEWKIGEIFEHNGEWYQCVEDITDDNCNNCCLQESCNYLVGDCSSTERSDGKTVAFKKLEKFGEPYISSRNKKRYQLYRCFCLPIITKDRRIEIGDANWVGIEIKQTKEDMEEKYSELTGIVHEYMEKDMTYKDFKEAIDYWVDDYMANKVDKLNLKPFDLEAAKAGKPVCTRDGRKARIICFDAKGNKPIIALIEDIVDKETTTRYLLSGRLWNDNVSDNDLMMLPEKKEGFMNVYKCNLYNTESEARKAHMKEGYIDTIKIEWEE